MRITNELGIPCQAESTFQIEITKNDSDETHEARFCHAVNNVGLYVSKQQQQQSLIWSDFLFIPASCRYDSSVSSNTISIQIIRFKCLFQGFVFLTFFSHILKDEALRVMHGKNPRILQVFLISS